VPVFGACRGIQEINVALGGSLHYRVHQVPGMMDHRMSRDPKETTEHRFRLRHALSLTPGGYLEGLVGTSDVMVNSLHGQGVDRLGDGLVVEGVAPDGLVEAVRLEGAKTFTVGVQWHAEWRFDEHPLSKALFEAFGDAARARAAMKSDRAAVA
jgi:putative glutamine amidotransferase